MYNDVVWGIRKRKSKRKVMTHEETWAVPVGRWLHSVRHIVSQSVGQGGPQSEPAPTTSWPFCP
jgi:hypothetical protein